MLPPWGRGVCRLPGPTWCLLPLGPANRHDHPRLYLAKLEAHDIVLLGGRSRSRFEDVVTLCAACHHKYSRSKGR